MTDKIEIGKPIGLAGLKEAEDKAYREAKAQPTATDIESAAGVVTVDYPKKKGGGQRSSVWDVYVHMKRREP